MSGTAQSYGSAMPYQEGRYAASGNQFHDGDILLSVNGEPVQNAEGFKQQMQQAQGSETVSITVMRNGQQRNLNIRVPNEQAAGQRSVAKPALPNGDSQTDPNAPPQPREEEQDQNQDGQQDQNQDGQQDQNQDGQQDQNQDGQQDQDQDGQQDQDQDGQQDQDQQGSDDAGDN